MPLPLHQKQTTRVSQTKTGLTFKFKSYEKDDDFCSDDEHDAYACTDDGKGQQQECQAKSRVQSRQQEGQGKEGGQVQERQKGQERQEFQGQQKGQERQEIRQQEATKTTAQATTKTKGCKAAQAPPKSTAKGSGERSKRSEPRKRSSSRSWPGSIGSIDSKLTDTN